MLTEKEIQAIRYYIGDVSGKNAFWGDGKAYILLNALFYPGIATEQARAREGKYLNPAILEDPARLEDLLHALLSAFRKSALSEQKYSFRVERFSDYEIMRQAGRTISFTSTSENGFLRTYQDRIGISLMKFLLPAGTPCLVMKEILPEYAKPEEAEILLPPGMILYFTDLQIRKEEQQITDANGNSPMLSCLVKTGIMKKIILPETEISSADGAKAGQLVCQAIQSGETPPESEILSYILWKKAMTSHLINEIFF